MKVSTIKCFSVSLRRFFTIPLLAVIPFVNAQAPDPLDSARKLMQNQPDAAWQLIQDYRATLGQSREEQSKALELLADIHYYTWDSLSQAKTYYDSALLLTYEKSPRRFEIYKNITYILNQQNKPAEVVSIVNDLEKDAAAYDSLLYIKLLTRKGYAFFLLHQYDSSLFFLNVAKSGYENIGEQGEAFQMLNSIGVVLSESGDQVTAKNYFLEAYINAQQRQDTMFMRPLAQNLSIRLHELGELDSAKLFAERNLVFSRKYGGLPALMRAFGSLARINLELGEFSQSLKYADSVLVFPSRSLMQYQTTVNSVMRYKSEVYFKQNKLQEAKRWALRCKAHAQESGLLLYETEAAEMLHKIYKKLGDYESALSNYEQADHVRDSITGAENFERVKELNVRFETESKQREIDNLERTAEIQALTIDRQRYNLILGAAGILVLGAVGYLFFTQRLFREKQVRLTIRQKLLRLQLNPHFLYNAMNAIQFVILEGGSPKKASDYVAKFAQLTRQILAYSEEEEILLEDEISFLKNYVQIQQLRLKDPFSFHLTVAENIDAERILMPPMLAQPFVENAIEHGISSLGKEGRLEVEIENTNEQLEIAVRDNGVGRRMDDRGEHKSMATKITKERIAILKKKYQNTSFEIHDLTNEDGSSKGTEVIFRLPLIYD